jgi:hypothetical protein
MTLSPETTQAVVSELRKRKILTFADIVKINGWSHMALDPGRRAREDRRALRL